MKVILIDDDGKETVSEHFILGIRSQVKGVEDLIALQNLTAPEIFAAIEILLKRVQLSQGIPDPPELHNEDEKKDEISDNQCTCGLHFGKGELQ
jgi:hypothetical protein